MFFNKPFHSVGYEDVVAFCKRQLPEGKQLDYKYLLPKNYEKFAKTIASFANALGGLIILGVQDDKNDKPCPPFTGIAYHEKMRNTIEDIIKVYIDPVVFVDINICVNATNDKMFVLIQIPQSNLTPHLVGKLKRAYIRTGQSSRPEVIVHPEKLPWLLAHREKSERLRHILHDKAESHFTNYLKTLTLSAEGETVSAISLVPLYPDEPLTDYRNLPGLIAASCARAPYGVLANPEFPLIAVQDGATIISNQRGVYRTTEFNTYGLVMNSQILSSEEIVNGHTASTLRVEKLAEQLVLFLLSARKFLDRLGAGGTLYFRLKLDHTRARRALFGKRQATVLEDYVRIDRQITLSDLQSKLPLTAMTLLHEAAWALGLDLRDSELHALQSKLWEGLQ